MPRLLSRWRRVRSRASWPSSPPSRSCALLTTGALWTVLGVCILLPYLSSGSCWDGVVVRSVLVGPDARQVARPGPTLGIPHRDLLTSTTRTRLSTTPRLAPPVPSPSASTARSRLPGAPSPPCPGWTARATCSVGRCRASGARWRPCATSTSTPTFSRAPSPPPGPQGPRAP